jgi:PAS domain S-box-containing protein
MTTNSTKKTFFIVRVFGYGNKGFAVSVLLVGLALTTAGSVQMQKNIHLNAEREFQRSVARVSTEIDRRFSQPIYGLNGLKGMFAAFPNIKREEFRRGVASRNLAQEFPGLRGLGYIEHVTRQNVAGFVAATRADGAPQFSVHQLLDKEREDLFVIKYIEPEAGNERAFGLDVASEAFRRTALEQSVDEGRIVMSRIILLVQDSGKTPGTLIYLPIYAEGAKKGTVQDRRESLVGLLYAPIVFSELLEGTTAAPNSFVDFKLQQAGSDSLLIYTTKKHTVQPGSSQVTVKEPLFVSHRAVTINGLDVTLDVTSTPEFDAQIDHSTPWVIFLLGLLLSSFLCITLPLVVFRRRATELQMLNDKLQQSNKSLAKRTAELADAQKIALIGNWGWNFETEKRFVSDELIRQFGPDLISSFVAKDGRIFPPDAQRQLDEAIAETCRTGASYSLEVQAFDKEGSLIWVNVRGHTVCGDSGEVIGLRGTMQDTTQHKTAEKLILESKTSLQMAMASSELALWDWKIQSDELFFDARWADIVGYPLNELPTKRRTYSQDVFSEDRRLIQKSMEAHFKGVTSRYDAIYRMRHKDGHTVWIQCTGKVVEWDAEGKPLRMLGVALDITERKQNELTMKELQAELDSTLVWQVAQHTVAALAHEINQPLASASILCTAANRMLVKEGLSGVVFAEKAKLFEQVLTSIESDVVRAGGILKTLLKSLHKPNITRVPMDINELVTESISTAYEEGVFGYPIITDCADDLPPVKVNQLQVKKVLLNLIHNGAQAMQGAQIVNGKIMVSMALAAEGHEICITVQDDGPGISALIHEEVFQPFITTKPHGVGMGLTISRALIEAHGGKLWATQTAGQGATFHFTLPIKE